jgi:tetratricopeptide (TPR) repeat protein
MLASLPVSPAGQTKPGSHPDPSTWHGHFAIAQSAQKNQDYATAEREYRIVLSLKPNFAEVHMNLGLVYQLQNRIPEAMAEFHRSLKLKPTLVGANFFLGVDYCNLGEGTKAIPYLKAAAQLAPDRADILSWLATAQEMSGDIHAEVATLQKALVLQPQNVDLLYLLGHAYERLGKGEVLALEKAAPGSARAEQLLGESYSASSEWTSAVLRFQNALAASANTPGVHVELGEVLLREGKLKRAAEEFAEELKLNPESLRALVRRGEVRLIQGDLEGALLDWTQALTTDKFRAEKIPGIRETGFGDAAFEQLPDALRQKLQSIAPDLQGRNSPAAQYALALLGVQNGDPLVATAEPAQTNSSDTPALNSGTCSEAEVRELLKREHYSEARPCAIRVLKPSSPPEFRIQLARVLFELGDYGASLEVLSRLAPADRSSPEVSYWRARCYEKLATSAYLSLYQADPNSYRLHQIMGDLAAAKNDDGKAVEEYRAAIALKPALPNLHYSLGHVLWKDLKVKEAREEFEAELAINPQHPGALNEIGDAYLLEHQPEKALPYLTKAVAIEAHNPDFHRDVGTAYSDLHNYEKAAAEFQIAVSGDHDGSVHYKLARVYQAMGQKKKAAREFELSTALNQESHSKLEKQTERLDQIERWTRE